MGTMLVVCIAMEVTLTPSEGGSSPVWKGEACWRRLGSLPGCRCSCQIGATSSRGQQACPGEVFQQACWWDCLLGAPPQLPQCVSCWHAMHGAWMRGRKPAGQVQAGSFCVVCVDEAEVTSTNRVCTIPAWCLT